MTLYSINLRKYKFRSFFFFLFWVINVRTANVYCSNEIHMRRRRERGEVEADSDSSGVQASEQPPSPHESASTQSGGGVAPGNESSGDVSEGTYGVLVLPKLIGTHVCDVFSRTPW